MAHLLQQTTLNPNVAGSIPAQVTSSSRVFEFLKNVAIDTRSESTATDRKIVQFKAQRKTLRERNKKIKQRIREQIEKLKLNEQEIDNIEMSIAQLQDIRDNEEEMDMK